jgi:heat shock protein HtpX
MMRVLLYLATNFAVGLVLLVVASLLGVDRYFAGTGLNVGMLAVFSVIMGFGGSLISLLLSKTMAIHGMGVRVIEAPSTADEHWLVSTVQNFAQKAGIGMPQVGIYEGAPNAFATGAFRDSALVAVSTGLLQSMTHEEVEAVLGHEISHVGNGDMVTLTLIQGVVNTFVVFLSRVVGYVVDSAMSRGEREGPGIGYMVTVFVCQIVFGIAASVIVAWFSRYREFRADAGAATLMGTPRPMVSALKRLGGLEAGELTPSMQAFGIAPGGSFLGLFASHPPIQARIAALESRRP